MKTQNNFILAILSIFWGCSVCSGQSQITAKQQASMERLFLLCHKDATKSAYIFEGKVMQEKSYYGKNQVVGTDIIQITKIFKGSPQLKLGSIKVVGGQYVKNGDAISMPSEGRHVGIYKDSTYIIFCRPADAGWLVDSTKTDNTITLTVWGMDEAIVLSGVDSVRWYGTPQFKTVEDIDAFFNENGLTVQEEIQQK